MNTISFQNSQNVNIQFQKAKITERISAFFVDTLVLIALFFVFFALINFANGLLDILYLIPILVGMFYNYLSEIFLEGQTIGKKLLKIKVISMSGEPAKLSQYTIRWIFRLIDIFFIQGIVAVLIILIGGKGQRLGDILAGTIVIRTEEEKDLSSLLVNNFEEDYVPVILQAQDLSAQQVLVIKKVLKLGFESQELALKRQLEKKLKEQLHINSDLRGKAFLEQLLKDYHYFALHQYSDLG